ncbi:MAG: PIG-L deacetylase family protein [Actinomycetota bacterium]
MDLGTILGVWAHPDDDAFLSSGVMADAVRKGLRVVCVTATRGELGSWDEERWPSETMGEVRVAELEESLAILGVAEHHWLDYPDGGCAEVPVEEAAGRLAAIVEEAQPDSVLTFGPEGMTGHPDHEAVSAWATEGFRRAAGSGARLFYATKTPEYVERLAPMLGGPEVFSAGTPPATPREELGIDFVLPEDLLDLKMEALAAHRSQMEGLLTVFGPELFREDAAAEWFVLAEMKL